MNKRRTAYFIFLIFFKNKIMDAKRIVIKPPLEFIRTKIIPDKINIKIFKKTFSIKNKLSKLNTRYNKTRMSTFQVHDCINDDKGG